MHLVKRRLKDGRISWNIRDSAPGKLVENLGTGLSKTEAKKRLEKFERECKEAALSYDERNMEGRSHNPTPSASLAVGLFAPPDPPMGGATRKQPGCAKNRRVPRKTPVSNWQGRRDLNPQHPV